MTAQPHDFRAYAPAGVTPDVVRVLLSIPMDQRLVTYARLTGDDGDGAPVICSAPGCGAVVPLRQAHCGRIEHNYTADIAPASRCGHALADSGQHFACSLEHLRAVLFECWDSHLTPQVNANLSALAQLRAAPPPQEIQEEVRP